MHAHVRVRVCMFICVCACACICACVRMRVHANMRVCLMHAHVCAHTSAYAASTRTKRRSLRNHRLALLFRFLASLLCGLDLLGELRVCLHIEYMTSLTMSTTSPMTSSPYHYNITPIASSLYHSLGHNITQAIAHCASLRHSLGQ